MEQPQQQYFAVPNVYLAAQEGVTRMSSPAKMVTTTEKVTSLKGNSTSGAPPWCPVLEQDSEVSLPSFLASHFQAALPGVGSDGQAGALGRVAEDERAG